MDALARLRPSLRRWGVLRSDAVERALEALDWDALLPDVPGRLGHLFAPERHEDGSFGLTPRASVLLAELLELGPDLRVALPMPRPRVLAALVERMGARLFNPLRDKEADRTLELAPARRLVPLAEGGFALEASFEPHDEALTKRIRSGEEVRIGVEGLPLHPGLEPARPIRHLLVVEGFLRRAIEERPRTRQDEAFAEAVAETWDPAASRKPQPDARRLEWARRWFALGYVHHFSADLVDAAELYQASAEALATGEAYTFLGWAYATGGDYPKAIEECERAIATDPEFGNPYNDIGAYLLEVGQAEAALPWFERALKAARYEAPHFAHFNAGRALLELGRPEEARRAFEKALAEEPGYRPAAEYLKRLPR